MGSQGLRVVLAFALLAALAGGLFWSLRSGDEPAATPAPAPAGPTATPTGSAAPTDAPVPPPSPAATSSTAVEPDVADALTAATAALAAWGEFAVSKDLTDLGGWFAIDGPQYAVLEAESEAPGAPLGPPPYEFIIEEIALETATETEVVLRADLIFGRPGESPQAFVWDIVMRNRDGTWRLWTAAEPGR